MPFFHIDSSAKRKGGKRTEYSLDLLHRQQCNVCPLNNQTGLMHPHMEPHGARKPLVYIIGEAPGAEEDKEGVPFVGPSGEVLHLRIPDAWIPHIRWSNVVRTRPPGNRTPTKIEVECCRPSVEADIEKHKPVAIFGFGNVPLEWALGVTGITGWSGRRIPIKVGSHTCWFFPMLHPSYILHTRKFVPRTPREYGNDLEFRFALDIEAAFEAVENLPEPIVHTPEMALENIECVTDADRVIELLKYAAEEKIVGFDYETNMLRPFNDDTKILTVAVATRDLAFSYPISHPDTSWSVSDHTRVLAATQEFIYDPNCRKVVHHLGFEMEWTAVFFGGARALYAGKWGDTLTQSYTLDERLDMHSLDTLCRQYFGIDLKALSMADTANLERTPLAEVLRYNALDAKYHRLLYLEQRRRLKEEKLEQVYRDLLRRIPALVLTQIKGVPVNQEVAKKFERRFSRRVEKVERLINDLECIQHFRKLRGQPYRPGSAYDLRYVLTKQLNIFLDGGVDEAALRTIDHPLARLTLRYRKNLKLLSTYIKPVLEGSPHLYADSLTHQILNTIKTRTSRTSAEHPNWQNFPKRNEIGRTVRGIVRPGSGYKVVAFDYASIQVRNIAMESRDAALVKAFWERYDTHADWMHRIAKQCPRWVEGGSKQLNDKEVAKKYRHLSKNKFVFPSLFGAGSQSISTDLGVSVDDATKLQEQLWEMFPDVHRWHRGLFKQYRQFGYVAGLSGIRRRAPISPNQLINAPIQADEALIVCSAMASLAELEDPRFYANFEIHDDLTFIWPAKEVDKNIETVVTEMLRIQFDWINVPLEVEVSVGDDWATLEEIGKYSSDKWKVGA